MKIKIQDLPLTPLLKLGKFFSVPAEFWMNLQTLYDIEEAKKRYKKDIESIHAALEVQHSAA